MAICRLCADQKRPEEIAFRLSDSVSTLTFQGAVEYYCRISLSADSDLPQTVCEDCTDSLMDIIKFSYKVETKQSVFVKEIITESQEVSDDEDLLVEVHKEREANNNLKSGQKKDPKVLPNEESQKPNSDWKVESVSDIQESEDEDLLVEVPEKETHKSPKKVDKARPNKRLWQDDPDEEVEVSSVSQKKEPKQRRKSMAAESTSQPLAAKTLRERRKSVFMDQTIQTLMSKEQTVSRIMEDVDKSFSHFPNVKLDTFVTVKIKKTKLLKFGEVPAPWLMTFQDLKKWDHFKYNCKDHCKQKFEGFFPLLDHLHQHRKSQKIDCFLCPSKSFDTKLLSTYINHMTRTHYEFLKFCCIVCSKVFYNMPMLSQHYQREHDQTHLRIFPCLDCGLYCQSFCHLRSHLKSHNLNV